MRSYKSRSKEVLFLGGWLFTDLLLLLTMLFFIGNIDVKPPTAIPTPTPTPVLPRLELQYTRIQLSIDPDGLLNDSPSAKGAVEQQIRQQAFLYNRSVGLAVAYGGAPDAGQISSALAVAGKLYDVLRELGNQGFAFDHASYYDPLSRIGADRTFAMIDVYLFVK